MGLPVHNIIFKVLGTLTSDSALKEKIQDKAIQGQKEISYSIGKPINISAGPAVEEEKMPIEEYFSNPTIDDIENNYSSEIDGLEPPTLYEKIKEAKVSLKLFEEEEALDNFHAFVESEEFLYKENKQEYTEKILTFLEGLSTELKVLVLGVLTYEEVSKLPKRVRVLAGNIRSQVFEKKGKRETLYGDESADSDTSAVFDEVYDDPVERAREESTKRANSKNKPKTEETKKEAITGTEKRTVSLKTLESTLKLDDSSINFLAERMLMKYLELTRIRCFLVVPSNFLRLMESVMTQVEAYFEHQKEEGKAGSEKLQLSASIKEIAAKDLLDNLWKFLGNIAKLYPKAMLMRTLKPKKQLLIDRILGLAPLVTSSSHLGSSALEIIKAVITQTFKDSTQAPVTLSPKPDSQVLSKVVKIAFESDFFSKSSGYSWLEYSIKIPALASDILLDISQMLNQAFAALFQTVEKKLASLKSKSEPNAKELISHVHLQELKRISSLLYIASEAASQGGQQESLLQFAEALVQNDVITESVLIMSEIIEKLAENLTDKDFQKQPLLFYLIAIVSYHFYFYRIDNDRHNPAANHHQKSELDGLEPLEPTLSRYFSRGTDIEPFDRMPGLKKSYSEVRRTKLEGVNLDDIFSHLTYKTKELFQFYSAVEHKVIQVDKILKELSKQRHWMTTFQQKYDYLWYEIIHG